MFWLVGPSLVAGPARRVYCTCCCRYMRAKYILFRKGETIDNLPSNKTHGRVPCLFIHFRGSAINCGVKRGFVARARDYEFIHDWSSTHFFLLVNRNELKCASWMGIYVSGWTKVEWTKGKCGVRSNIWYNFCVSNAKLNVFGLAERLKLCCLCLI